MANPGESEESAIEVNSDRRSFMTVAAAAGVAGAVAIAAKHGAGAAS